MSEQQSRAGFSVIEVLIALSMGVIIILSVGNALAAQDRLTVTSRQREQALSYARQGMETIQAHRNAIFGCSGTSGLLCTTSAVPPASTLSLCTGLTICPAVFFYRTWEDIAMRVNQLNQFKLAVLSSETQVQNYFSGSPAVDPSVVSFMYYNIYVQPRWLPGWNFWHWEIVDTHEDWFLHDNAGNRIYNTQYGNPATGEQSLYYMDVTNQGYRDYIIGVFQAIFETFPVLDGLYIDGPPRWEYFSPYELPNLSCYASGDCPTGTGQVWNSPTTFYNYLTPGYDEIFSDPSVVNKYMIVNSNCAPEFNAVSDGCLHEHAFHYYDRSVSNMKYIAGWIQDIKWLSDSSNDDRIEIVWTGVNTSNMTAADRQQVERFEYASFLIGQNANSTALMAWMQDTTEDITYNPLNDVDLGAPTGPYVANYQGQLGVYYRQYEKGIVLVHAWREDPARTITLADTYRTLDGNLVTGSLTLQPDTGHILTLVDVSPASTSMSAAAAGQTCTPRPGYSSCWVAITTDPSQDFQLDASGTSLQSGTEPLGQFTRSIRLNNIGGDTNVKEVTVNVSWAEGGSTKHVSLTTRMTAWQNF